MKNLKIELTPSQISTLINSQANTIAELGFQLENTQSLLETQCNENERYRTKIAEYSEGLMEKITVIHINPLAPDQHRYLKVTELVRTGNKLEIRVENDE